MSEKARCDAEGRHEHVSLQAGPTHNSRPLRVFAYTNGLNVGADMAQYQSALSIQPPTKEQEVRIVHSLLEVPLRPCA